MEKKYFMWTTPFIILHTHEDGECKLVHEAETLKDAKYYLSYIAEPGDAIFGTPIHPQHNCGNRLQYKAHTIVRKEITYNEQQWLQFNTKNNCPPKLPQ